jgi:hypothetical protein
MLAIYRRLGLPVRAQMVRFVRLLQAEALLRSLVRMPALARGLSRPVDYALALRPRLTRLRSSLSIALQAGPCNEEFSDLARRGASRLGLCVDRSAGYLNWRYRTNPLSPHEIVTARRHGDLVAYAVVTVEGSECQLVDFLAADDAPVLGELLEALATLLRARGCRAISAPILASHPWLPILRAHGFVARESRPVVIHAPHAVGPLGIDGYTLSLTHGDRDS